MMNITAGDLIPVIFLQTPIYWGLAFHCMAGILPRLYASWAYPNDAKKRDVVGRYTPSLIHAFLSAFWTWIVPASLSDGYYNLLFNSGGYFFMDMIIDRDPDYFFHHLAPIMWGEALFRSGSDFYWSITCIRLVEVGNVFAHTAAILTTRSGKVFHYINTASFWISRPLSMIPGFLAWWVDVPAEQKFRPWGLSILMAFVVTFYINGKWMIKMITPRPPKESGTKNEKIENEKEKEKGKKGRKDNRRKKIVKGGR